MENKDENKTERELTKVFKTGKVKTILKGTAPEQHNPQPVNIEGTITAVSRFIKNRKNEFYDKKAHCLVSKSDGQMKLVVNEQSVVDKYTVKGTISIGKRFKELGINTDKSYEPIELSKKFRLLRSIFPSHADHTRIVTSLAKMEATVNQKYNSSQEDNGNVKMSFDQVVDSNIPKSFRLKLPLLEGEDPVEIEINIILVSRGAMQIQCFLESVEGADMIEELRTKLVLEEVEKIENDCTVIFY